jgi:hypothetical protein
MLIYLAILVYIGEYFEILICYPCFDDGRLLMNFSGFGLCV